MTVVGGHLLSQLASELRGGSPYDDPLSHLNV